MKFTLEPRTWYALEYTFPSGERHVSPIWVTGVMPRKTGRGDLDLMFWHANYPEGVRDKSYTLRVLHREEGYVSALSEHGANRFAALLLLRITHDWVRRQFASLAGSLRDEDNLPEWLDRTRGRPR